MTVPDEVSAAERAVVGDCIMIPATVRQVAGIVAPDDFSDLRLGNLYGLIAGMVSGYGPDSVTVLSVVQEVSRRQAEAPSEGKIRNLYPDRGEIAAIATHGISGATETHARMVRQEAVGRSLAVFGRRLVQDVEKGADPALLASAAVEDAKAIRDGWRTSKLSARLLADVMAQEDDPYDWLIPGLLERLDRLIVTGGEGAGKSTLTKQLGICLAGGMHPFTGEQIPAKTVLVVDCENSERQWRRSARGIVHVVRSGGSGDPGENMHLRCLARMDITSPADLGAIHGLIDDTEPDMLLIGPLYRLVPRAITNDDDAAPVLAALDSLRDRGVALVMEAHAGHAQGKGGERDYRPRGSSALMGWPEFGFGLAVDTDDPKQVQVIRWRGDRDERNWPPRLRRGGTLPWTDDRREPEHEEQRNYVRGVAS